MSLDEGETVVSMAVIKPDDLVVTISENGYGKRSKVSDFRLTARGSKGVKAGVFNEKTGALIGLAPVEENEDLMLIADSGVIIRTPVKDISIIGRVSQGVRIMKLRDGAKLVAFALTEHEDVLEGEDASSEGEAAPAEGENPEVNVEAAEAPPTETTDEE